MSTLSKNAELAKSIQNGIFAKRETLTEAFAYANDVFSATRHTDQIAVVTAMQVVLNTLAAEILKNEGVAQ
jgi:hypothetical protein